ADEVHAQKKMGGGGEGGKERKKKNGKPPYPAIAKNARASGAVQLQILISETGEVIDATVIAGHPVLRDAALQAARQWVFKPTELSGVAVKIQGGLTLHFSLEEEEPSSLSSLRKNPKNKNKTEQPTKKNEQRHQ